MTHSFPTRRSSDLMHGDIRQKSELGLRKARVASYGGMNFATWSEEAPEFEVYLGDMKFYLDMLFCRTDNGLEVLGPPQRVLVTATWNTAVEPNASDGITPWKLHRT